MLFDDIFHGFGIKLVLNWLSKLLRNPLFLFTTLSPGLHFRASLLALAPFCLHFGSLLDPLWIILDHFGSISDWKPSLLAPFFLWRNFPLAFRPRSPFQQQFRESGPSRERNFAVGNLDQNVKNAVCRNFGWWLWNASERVPTDSKMIPKCTPRCSQQEHIGGSFNPPLPSTMWSYVSISLRVRSSLSFFKILPQG